MNEHQSAELRMRCLELAAKYAANAHDLVKIAERLFREFVWKVPYQENP